MTAYRLIFKGSPFLPCFDQIGSATLAVHDIHKGMKPSAAIAQVANPLMEIHVALLRQSPENFSQFGLQVVDLEDLSLGYQYPLNTLLASAICLPLPQDERPKVYEELLILTHDFRILRVQDQIFQDLKATVNLLRMDPSGSLVFDYLKKYPCFSHEMFLTGMEIATIIFFGLSQEVAKQLGDDHWLTAWQGGPEFS